jgi:hypothetical protein
MEWNLKEKSRKIEWKEEYKKCISKGSLDYVIFFLNFEEKFLEMWSLECEFLES